MSLVKGPLGYAAVFLAAATMLSGCEMLRSAAGNDKQPPDEFAVVTKAPLIIPPDYNLRPPKLGAAPANEVEPSEAAQQSLFGSGTGSDTSQANMSEGEKSLLANAGAQSVDPAIRQEIATDRHKDEEAASDEFTNTVLFWTNHQKDEGIDPDAALKAGATGPVGVKPAVAVPSTIAADSSGKNVPQASADTAAAAAATAQAPADAANTTAADATAQTNSGSSATIEKKKKSDSGGLFDWF